MNMPRWKVELAVLVKIVAPPPDERKIDDCNDLPVVTCVSDPPEDGVNKIDQLYPLYNYIITIQWTNMYNKPQKKRLHLHS